MSRSVSIALTVLALERKYLSCLQSNESSLMGARNNLKFSGPLGMFLSYRAVHARSMSWLSTMQLKQERCE